MVSVKAQRIIAEASAAGMRIATAESCTGGLVAAALTDIPGASNVFDRGFVTYSNDAKAELLDVPAALITQFGAVSAETAHAMVLGALSRSIAALALSVTGIAGPGGGSDQKPVGLVYFGCARRGGAARVLERRFGPLTRDQIRVAAVDQALDLLLEALAQRP